MQFFHTILHLDRYLITAVATYGAMIYAVLFAIVFCEIAFLPLFFLPGDPLLFLCGALCATGAMNPWILALLLFAAAVIGSLVNYWIGHAIGQKVFVRNYRWLNRTAFDRTHAFYEKYGGITFVLSPFIAVVRTFAPFVAGATKMTFKKFQFFSTLGGAIWTVSLVSGGYFFGNIPAIRMHLNGIVMLGVGAGVGSLLVGGLWKFSRKFFAAR